MTITSPPVMRPLATWRPAYENKTAPATAPNNSMTAGARARARAALRSAASIRSRAARNRPISNHSIAKLWTTLAPAIVSASRLAVSACFSCERVEAFRRRWDNLIIG